MATQPEHRLLLSCGRSRVNEQAEERIHGCLVEEIDWEEFVRLTKHHGMVPLVHRNLSRFAAGQVPESVGAELQAAYRLSARYSAQLSLELISILRLLRGQGVSGVPFKGPVLARLAYGDVSLRESSDLDVLVRGKEVLAAKVVLTDHGYQPIPRMPAAQEALLVEKSPYAYAFTLGRESGNFVFDLHWRIAEKNHPAFPNDLNDDWKNLAETDIDGVALHTFGPEDTLRLLCAHAAKHDWRRLKWICDLSELLSACPAIDWERVQAGASRTGIIGTRTLLVTVLLADRLLDAPLPAAVLNRAESDRIVASLAEEAEQRLLSGVDNWPAFWPRSFRTDISFLKMAERTPLKVSYFLSFCALRVMAPDAKDRALLPLPSWLSFLHYVVRPFRLLAEYGLRPLGDLALAVGQALGLRRPPGPPYS